MPSIRSYRFTSAIVCGSLMISSSAASASTSINSWAALSAFGTQSSRAAACGTSAAVAGAAAAAAQAPATGCVLPVADAPPPPVAAADPLPPPALETGGGFGVSPLVLALGALALGGLIYLIASGDDDEGSPISPS